ncbi:MAG: NFACT family protein [Ruminococcus sp.]|nr:NFACT family protein [Ruminococcus sp.]
MALDGIYLSLLKKEFETLIGARVDKIHQPTREELVIGFRTREGGKKLLINAGSGSARIHLTTQEIENPKTPPMLCMLLRKHLSSGRLIDIRQDGFERILFLDFESTDELGDRASLTLVVEIMGRCSNVILVSGEGRIIDSIHRVNPDGSARPVLPGMKYEAPPREQRLNIFAAPREELEHKLKEFPKAELSKTLLKVCEGISPIFARECADIALHGGDAPIEDMKSDDFDRLACYIKSIGEQIENGENHYTLVRTKEGAFKDFCFCDVTQYGSLMDTKSFGSPSELLDHFYLHRDMFARAKQKASDLFKLVSNLTERTRRRVENQKAELLDCADRDKYRIYGDLIMANIGELIKGMSWCSVTNYYDEELSQMQIPLDKKLSPQENAQKYYSLYRKLDTAEGKLKKLIVQGEEELVYLDSVYESLTRAQTESELTELRQELADEGYIRLQGTKNKPPKALPPMRFKSEGFVIRVGRNNRQNDRLTCKESEKTDLWLHTKDITGSHVIISAEGKEIPGSVIYTAARLAAYFSKGKDSSQVAVDYTPVRYVKKPNGAKPGMVIFTNNKTMYVAPLSSEEVDELKSPL